MMVHPPPGILHCYLLLCSSAAFDLLFNKPEIKDTILEQLKTYHFGNCLYERIKTGKNNRIFIIASHNIGIARCFMNMGKYRSIYGTDYTSPNQFPPNNRYMLLTPHILFILMKMLRKLTETTVWYLRPSSIWIKKCFLLSTRIWSGQIWNMEQ